MIQHVDAPVSVDLIFNHRLRKVFPKKILWEGNIYEVKKVGLHHAFRRGRTLFHVFSVESKTLFFRLVLNTDNLFWRVEEISDGETN